MILPSFQIELNRFDRHFLFLETAHTTNDFFSVLEQNLIVPEKLKEYIITQCNRLGIEKIQWANFKEGFLGLAFENTIYLSFSVLRFDPPFIFHVLFHEMAHAHQFKKYGWKKMFQIIDQSLDLDEMTKFLISAERAAEKYAYNKMKFLVKHGFFDDDDYSEILVRPRNNFPVEGVKKWLNGYRNELNLRNISSKKDLKKITEYYYTKAVRSLSADKAS